MNALQFSTRNIIALHKFETCVRKITGLRFTLSEETSLLSLWGKVSESDNSEVKGAFEAFVVGLDTEQKKQLVYRGVTLDYEAYAKTVSSEQPVGKKSILYRGVKVETTVPSDEAKQNSDSQRKKQRVYRGQIIK
ncbi:hypothetical protein [Halioxenophilus aromaticivorans]|uniref:Uncharacterized protein n=1 Tax=Halioxenophilus aromaticivorans TaxID=1306992 RepID=A0AAV3U6A8_9ALTE